MNGKISDDDVAKLLSVFKTSGTNYFSNQHLIIYSKSNRVFFTLGVVSDIGGITKFRTLHDLKDTIQETNSAFDMAINQAKNRPKVGSENFKGFIKQDNTRDCLLLNCLPDEITSLRICLHST